MNSSMKTTVETAVDPTKRRYLTQREVYKVYGIGWRGLEKLCDERRLTRRKVRRAYYYSVRELELVFSGAR